jgi:hypothetical protein
MVMAVPNFNIVAYKKEKNKIYLKKKEGRGGGRNVERVRVCLTV